MPPGLILLASMGYMIFLYVDASPFKSPFYGAEYPSLRRTDGNPTAAADLYGIGVRIGIYLQSIGMLISLFQTRGKGYKLAISSNSNGLLLAWTILMSRKAFSFCEAFLILAEVGCFLIPGLIIVADFQIVPSEIVGLIGMLVAFCWMNAGGLWLFTTHYTHLKPLGQPSGWMFARVSLDGWFRIFAIVVYSIACLLLLITVTWVTFLVIIVLNHGDDEKLFNAAFENRYKQKEGKDQKIKELLKCLRRWGAGLGFVIWVLSVAACEMIIVWNDLSPETSLTKPGQTIPLTIGIIIATDGVSSFLRYLIFRKKVSNLKYKLKLDGVQS